MAAEISFFSYSRSDSAFVLKLAKDLRDAGADLWLDQLDIRAGSHWDASIEAALNMASRMIVILSPASVGSNNVMDEVSFALENNKTVIPVLLAECKPPFRLRRLQRIDFTVDYNTGLKQLLDVLGYGQSADPKQNALVDINEEKPADPAPPDAQLEEDSQPILQSTIHQKDFELENLLWAKARESDSDASYQHYLQEYPRGRFEQDALAAIRNLEKKKKLTPDKSPEKPALSDISEKKGFSKRSLAIGAGIILLGLGTWAIVNMTRHSKSDPDDLVAWQIALKQNDSSGYAGYMRNFPKSVYYLSAKEKLDSLAGKGNHSFLVNVPGPREDSIRRKYNDSLNTANYKHRIDSLNAALKKRASDSLLKANIIVRAKHWLDESFGGGIIIKLNATGEHGLIVAKTDMVNITLNDAKIACQNLVIDGFRGWRLPTQSEQLLMNKRKSSIPGLNGNWYWSSTTLSNGAVWGYCFRDPASGSYAYAGTLINHARAVRSF